MPFLRKITGNHHNHNRSGSSPSLKFGSQIPSLTPQQQQDISSQSPYSEVSPTSSKSMHFHAHSSSKSSRDSTNSDATNMMGTNGYSSNSDAPSPKLSNLNIKRKKPPQLSLDHSKNSARNSIVSNMSGLSNLNEDEANTFYNDALSSIPSNSTPSLHNHSYTGSTTPHAASKRISTAGSSTLSDNLTLYTLDDNHTHPGNPHHTPALAYNPNLSHSDNYGTPLGSVSSNSNSRKSSGGNSTNTLSFDKLILSWDPTDPEEWTLQRVISWLKFHEFPDQWVSFFKKNQLYGNNFIKLLAYDNFQAYERQLNITKMGSYSRFQDLLKKTMTKNVTNNHRRQKSQDKNLTSNKSSTGSSRSSSDSLPKKKSRSFVNDENYGNVRSTSEYVLSPTKSASSRSYQNNVNHDDKAKLAPLRSHQKTKSASALYRRSFISLRGPSASSAPPNANGNNANHSNNNSKSPGAGNTIKLNIPTRPLSTLETNTNSFGSNHNNLTPSKSNTSPLSPGIFRRHHKSSSSESSLLNVIFGSTLSTPTNQSSNSTPQNHSKHNSQGENDKTPTHKSFLASHNNTNHHTHHHTASHGVTYQPPSLPDKNANHKKRHSISNDNLLNTRSQSNVTTGSHNSESSTSMLRPVKNEEKETLWDKLKRRSQIGMGYSTTTSTPTTATGIPTPSTATKSNSSLVTLTSSNIDHPTPKGTPKSTPKINPTGDMSLKKSKLEKSVLKTPVKPEGNKTDNAMKKSKRLPTSSEIPQNPFKDYYPILKVTTKPSPKDKFIWVSRNSVSFLPVNVGGIKDIQQLRSRILDKLGIPNDHNLSIHMADFYNNIGPSIPDNILESIVAGNFENTTMKFYVKEPIKMISRTRASTLPNEPHQQLRSVKSRNSVRSIASSIATDDVSIITSSSDVTSSEDHIAGAGRRYPQTPSIYYDTAGTTKNNDEETNYWNIKEHLPPEQVQKQIVQNALQSESEKNNSGSIHSGSIHSHATPPRKNSKSSFQVFMKDDTKEIDFNKRRESPYVIPELAPKREAPKPPSNISPPRGLSHYKSAPHLRRTTSKIHRKPPPPSSGKLVGSYTPGSTQVMVPQPYKGATEVERKLKSDDDDIILNPVSNFMLKQRVSRSNSTSSQNHSIFNGTSPFLKRGASRRIVSSASAADVFEENDITFADAPLLSDEDEDSDDSSSDDIIWSNKAKPSEDKSLKESKPTLSVNTKEIEESATPTATTDDNSSPTKTSSSENKNNLTRKMTLRPSPEEVYENLEKFFPHAYLDKPIVEKLMTPNSPKPKPFSVSKKPTKELEEDAVIPVVSPNGHHLPKRTRTIRTIAHEANQARKSSMRLKRQNTKMWGTRMVEVTEKQQVSINKSKNSRGQYKEFAWMKGEMIGKGSFGAVYLCLNLTTGEMMAVKQVEVPRYSAQDQNILDMVQALKSEVNTLKDLDHLNIVQYLGFEEKNSIYSLFLEYVAGGSVGSLIRLYGKFDEGLIRHLTVQVLKGLSYLHSRGILHRDMKADNLLLDQDGVCKISDFGISRRSKDIYSNSDMTMRGTVFWMAPEMVDTKQGYSAKVDIWSLGCVVLEMFAGKRPWSNLEVVAAMFKIGKSKSAPPIPEDTLPLISLDGRAFLDACFEIDPELRPTADKLLSHPFSKVYDSFDFRKTKLAKFIKSNDKINSSKLRVTSQESSRMDTPNI